MNPQELKELYGKALTDTKTRAFLKTIQRAEGTARDNPMDSYRVMYGGGQFNDLSKHPDRVIHGGRYSSAAAGAYQFMPSTWEGITKELGLKDFNPESQNLAALHLIRRRYLPFGGLAGFQKDLEKGDIRTISHRLAQEWAALPTFSGNSAYGQPVKKLTDLQTYYNDQLKNPPQLPGALAAASQSPQKPQTTTPPAAGSGAATTAGVPPVRVVVFNGPPELAKAYGLNSTEEAESNPLDPLGFLKSINSNVNPLAEAQKFLNTQLQTLMESNPYNEDTA